jgi:hypothetical protein
MATCELWMTFSELGNPMPAQGPVVAFLPKQLYDNDADSMVVWTCILSLKVFNPLNKYLSLLIGEPLL